MFVQVINACMRMRFDTEGDGVLAPFPYVLRSERREVAVSAEKKRRIGLQALSDFVR